MQPLILRNVELNPIVEAFVKQHFEIISVDELNNSNATKIEVLLTNGTGKASKDLLDRLPNLKMIDDFGVGFDGIDVAECKRRGIAICTTPDVLTADVADLALALLMASSRKLPKAHHIVTSGLWEQKAKYGLGHKVSGKKVGIVGLGRIGKAVAKRCLGFEMEIAYYSPVVDQDGLNLGFTRYENLVDLARDVDFLIVCAAASQENNKLINHQVLSALGSKGILINIARGSLVDEAALVELLTTKQLGGAGLDVFANEPLVPKELWELDNVVLTPHIASATVETREQMANLVIGNLQAFMNKQPYLTALKW